MNYSCLEPLKAAANGGYLDLIKMVFSVVGAHGGCTVPYSVRLEVLKAALRAGNVDIVGWLLEWRGPMEEQFRLDNRQYGAQEMLIDALESDRRLTMLGYLLKWQSLDGQWFDPTADRAQCVKLAISWFNSTESALLCLDWEGPGGLRVDPEVVVKPYLFWGVHFGKVALVKSLLKWERSDGAKVFPTTPPGDELDKFIVKFTREAQEGHRNEIPTFMAMLDEMVLPYQRWSFLRRAWVGAVYMGLVCRLGNPRGGGGGVGGCEDEKRVAGNGKAKAGSRARPRGADRKRERTVFV